MEMFDQNSLFKQVKKGWRGGLELISLSCKLPKTSICLNNEIKVKINSIVTGQENCSRYSHQINTLRVEATMSSNLYLTIKQQQCITKKLFSSKCILNFFDRLL